MMLGQKENGMRFVFRTNKGKQFLLQSKLYIFVTNLELQKFKGKNNHLPLAIACS